MSRITPADMRQGVKWQGSRSRGEWQISTTRFPRQGFLSITQNINFINDVHSCAPH